eukprot:scaffold90685_cov69-Phaeocystis_antarctica.AAC.3
MKHTAWHLSAEMKFSGSCFHPTLSRDLVCFQRCPSLFAVQKPQRRSIQPLAAQRMLDAPISSRFLRKRQASAQSEHAVACPDVEQ